MGSVKKEKNGKWTVRYDLYIDGKRRQKMKRGFSAPRASGGDPAKTLYCLYWLQYSPRKQG